MQSYRTKSLRWLVLSFCCFFVAAGIIVHDRWRARCDEQDRIEYEQSWYHPGEVETRLIEGQGSGIDPKPIRLLDHGRTFEAGNLSFTDEQGRSLGVVIREVVVNE